MTERLLELTTLLTFWLCLAAWQRDRTTRGRRLFMGLCAALMLWSSGNLVQLLGALAPGRAQILSWLGILALPPLWLALALKARGARLVEHPAFLLAAVLLPALAAWLLLSPDPPAGRAGGPRLWLVGGTALLMAALGSFHFALSARRLRGRGDRLRRAALAGGSLLPLAASALYATTGMPGLDVTPMLLGAWLVGLRSELFSGDLLQALPVSQHDLLSQLPTPLILTDLSGRVTEINPAAQNCLGIAKADALDRNIEALLEGATFAPEFERWPLVAAGREAGSILLPAAAKRSEVRP